MVNLHEAGHHLEGLIPVWKLTPVVYQPLLPDSGSLQEAQTLGGLLRIQIGPSSPSDLYLPLTNGCHLTHLHLDTLHLPHSSSPSSLLPFFLSLMLSQKVCLVFFSEEAKEPISALIPIIEKRSRGWNRDGGCGGSLAFQLPSTECCKGRERSPNLCLATPLSHLASFEIPNSSWPSYPETRSSFPGPSQSSDELGLLPPH